MGVGPEIERKEKRVKVNESSPLKKYYGMPHPSEETLLDYIKQTIKQTLSALFGIVYPGLKIYLEPAYRQAGVPLILDVMGK